MFHLFGDEKLIWTRDLGLKRIVSINEAIGFSVCAGFWDFLVMKNFPFTLA